MSRHCVFGSAYCTEPLCGRTEPLRTPNTHNHCVTPMENNRQGPVLIRVSPIWKIGQNHYVGRQYTQHPQPLCNTNGKQLLGPRVNKGFPYMEYHTKQLYGHRVPLRTPNIQKHCVILMENNCHVPVFIRVSPVWKITQNLFAGRLYHYIHLSPTSTV